MREYVKLTSICTPKQWKTISTKELTAEGYPVYGANGIIGYFGEYNHQNETVMITCRGATCGTVNISVPKAYITGNAMCLDSVDESKVQVKYLYHGLKAYDFTGVISGSAQPQITREGLQKVKIPLIELSEQKKVVELLDKIESSKEKRKEQLAKLDDLVKSQFIEMFGDIKSNPNNFKVVSLQRLIDEGVITYHLDGNHGGEYPRNDEFIDSGVPYIGANCVVDGEVCFSNAKYLSLERAGRLKKGIAQTHDVLFAHNATVGPVAILVTDKPKVILSTSLTAFRCNRDKMNEMFLDSFLRSDSFVSQYIPIMKQTTRNQFPVTAQRKCLFMVPPIDLQNEFARFVEQTDKSKILFDMEVAA